jgi:hypothetical protein
MRVVLASALAAAALYAVLAGSGDLKTHLALYLVSHALLLVLMLLAWRAVGTAGPAAFRVMLVAAVAFRLIAAAGPASLSDDVYRYVWDGRVQAAGHHPYRYAPADPLRQALRDASIYPRINHPEIPTIYPPLAELVFAALAFARAGVTGFKVAFALFDVGVVFALLALLKQLGLPRHRVVLYAWNPLAVVEVAGSGHVEPLGILLVVLGLAWIAERKALRAGASLGGAIQAKFLPLILVFGFVRRMKIGGVLAMLAMVAVTVAPYAGRGPWLPPGLVAYARHWEHGAVLFAGVRAFFESVDAAPHVKSIISWAQSRWGGAETGVWDVLYRSVWPGELARITVAVIALAWAAIQAFRRQPSAAHEARLVLGGAVLLSPTLHPWYVLWLLPLAAAEAAGGWLLLGALVPLQYLAGGNDVPWWIRLTILLPALAWMTRDALIRFRR